MAERIIDTPIDKFIGCELPLNKNQYGYFSPTIYTIDQAKSNLQNLILTNKGERLMMPEFGCDIYKLLFDNIDLYEISEIVKSNISNAAQRWLPYISLKEISVDSSIENVDRYLLDIQIIFSLKNDDITEELTFSIYQS